MKSRNKAYLLLFALFLCLFAGCSSYEKVCLSDIADSSIISKSGIAIPTGIENGRYRYTMTANGRSFSMTCICERKSQNSYTLAGVSDLGVTMFAARVVAGKIEILANNLSMPDWYLEQSVVKDAIVVTTPPVCDMAVVKAGIDGELWYLAENNNGNAYYYAGAIDGLELIELSGESVVYRVKYFANDNSRMSLLKINNYRLKCQADIQVSY